MDHHPLGGGPRRTAEKPLTVSQVADAWNRTLRGLGSVSIVGEVSDLSHARSGHLYFTLTDGSARLQCKAWSSTLPRLKVVPSEGQTVVLRGAGDFYGPQGKASFTVSQCEPAGAGALAEALAALERRLRAEGLFDSSHKKELPLLPRRVGVVTSLEADGLADFLRSQRLRAPGIDILVAHSAVQGPRASAEIVSALERLDHSGRCDVIVLLRGGGAAEDLLPFSNEAVVRGVAACHTPVVVGVGHQPDHPLCELAADLAAHTPTHAAECVFPVLSDLDAEQQALQKRLARAARHVLLHQRHQLDLKGHRLRNAVHLCVMEETNRLQALDRRLREAHPLTRLRKDRLKLGRLNDRLNDYHPRFGLAEARHDWERLSGRLGDAAQRRLQSETDALAHLAKRLDSASPLKVLARGYSLVENEKGNPVGSTRELTPDQKVTLRFTDGRAKVRVEDVHRDG